MNEMPRPLPQPACQQQDLEECYGGRVSPKEFNGGWITQKKLGFHPSHTVIHCELWSHHGRAEQSFLKHAAVVELSQDMGLAEELRVQCAILVGRGGKRLTWGCLCWVAFLLFLVGAQVLAPCLVKESHKRITWRLVTITHFTGQNNQLPLC